MEDDLKISKVEYLRNCLLDHTQILNLDLGDQSKVTTSHGRRPQNIKSGTSQHLLDPTQILNLSLDYQKL